MAALLLLAGCEPKVVPYELELVTEACDGVAPMLGVTHLRIRITGDDIEPVERSGSVTLGRLEVPDIPAGPRRQVEVRGYEGPPPGGRVLALGRSIPFDVPAVVPPRAKPAAITVFVRRVNRFVPPSLAASPEVCTRMNTARSAHSATSLPDGRVLLAGGTQLLSAAGGEVTLESLELYNPSTGAFEPSNHTLGFAGDDGFPAPSPRAFHTATLLSSGEVWVAGGEREVEGRTEVVTEGLLLDPTDGSTTVVPLVQARSRHVVAVDEGGRVLTVGGRDAAGLAVSTAEFFDPVAGSTEAIALPIPRVGATAVPVQGGKLIAVAGGSDGASVSRDVLFLRFDGETFVGLGSSATMREARRAPAAAIFIGERLAVLGGYDAATDAEPTNRALATSELILPAALTASDGPAISARGELCAVSLPDGRVLSIGGRSGTGELVGTDGSAELLTPTPSGLPTVLGVPSLDVPRYRHACTLLVDGTVLVTGGEYDDTVTREVLQDAWIFTPAPID